MHTPDHITTEYEALHLKAQAKRAKEIERLYNKAITEAANIAALQRYIEGTVFDITKHIALRDAINDIVKKTQKGVTAVIQNGITDSWNLSNAKNDAIFDHRIDRSLLPKGLEAKFYNPNYNALTEFQKRATTNMKLSKKVWSIEKDFKRELEQSLGEGISNGKSAAKMAREAKEFLNEPDKLFRRVRDAKGKLKLSKAAKNYHPGQGVSRSSYKNAIRLTGTETNMAYRKADNVRYANTPMVMGFQVHLSNNHPKFDICDSLNLVYPCDFIYVAWHPRCRCFVTPILAPKPEIERYIQAVLDGKGDKFKWKDKVMEMPAGFNTWVTDNAERIGRLKNPPYFIRDNPGQSLHLLK